MTLWDYLLSNKRNKNIILGLVFCLSASAYAQNSIKATVSDSIANKNLSGVDTNSSDSEKKAIIDSAEYLSAKEFKFKIVYTNIVTKLLEESLIPQDYLELSKAAKYYYEDNWDSAYVAYSNLLEKHPEIKGHILMRMAKALNKQEKYSEARKLLVSWQSLKANKTRWTEADKIIVEGMLLDDSISSANLLDSLNFRLENKPDSKYEEYLKMSRADVYERMAKFNAAQYEYLELVATEGSMSYKAYKAYLKVKGKAKPANKFSHLLHIGVKQCATGEKTKCIQTLKPLLKRGPSSNTKKRIMENLANTYYSLKRYDDAIKYYKLLMDEFPNKQYWLHNVAKSYSRAGNKVESRKYYAEFKEKYPTSDRTAQMYWVKGFELEQAKKYTEATEVYTYLYETFPNNSKAKWAGFRKAFIQYKQGNYSKAIEGFKKVEERKNLLWPRTASLYLMADSYRHLKKDSLARYWYLETIYDFPVSYYAHQAVNCLEEFKLMDKVDIPKVTPLEMTYQETMNWIANNSGSYKGEGKYSRESYQEIEFLLAAGFLEEAEDMFFSIWGPYKKHLDFIYEYGLLFQKYGQLKRSHRLARSFNNYISRKKLLRAPESVLKWLYPAPYLDQIKKYANSETTDPFFVLSVIRQESIFDSDISSPVGARGFMQIMPYTGETLAKQQNIGDFDPDILYNPYMAIRLGVHYINTLFEDYNGNPYWVLANYNAGPKPARRWQLATKDLSWQIGAEEVSYYETRHYLKKCMGNYWTYQDIWLAK